MKSHSKYSLAVAKQILSLMLLLWVGGCATSPQGPEVSHTFYPGPPDPPRLQFLVSYSGLKDLGKQQSRFATFITGQEPPSEALLKPYGAAFWNGQLFICDSPKSGIAILDPAKQTMAYFSPTGQGQLRFPLNIAFDRDGTEYVADTGRNQVVIYGADGSYRGAIGGADSANPPPNEQKSTARPKGSAKTRAWDSAQMRPTDIAISGDRLFVTDLIAHCVHVYDKNSHQPLFTIPRDPNDARAKLYVPTNLTVDSHGRLYVSDLSAFRVVQYDADGNYLRSFGAGAGDQPGQFARPKGLAVDHEDRLYVVDAAAQVVQIFDPEGRLLLFFGAPDPKKADEPSLYLPAKVIIDYEHIGLFKKYAAPGFKVEYLVIVTNQFGKRLVSVYGFGRQERT